MAARPGHGQLWKTHNMTSDRGSFTGRAPCTACCCWIDTTGNKLTPLVQCTGAWLSCLQDHMASPCCPPMSVPGEGTPELPSGRLLQSPTAANTRTSTGHRAQLRERPAREGT